MKYDRLPLRSKNWPVSWQIPGPWSPRRFNLIKLLSRCVFSWYGMWHIQSWTPLHSMQTKTLVTFWDHAGMYPQAHKAWLVLSSFLWINHRKPSLDVSHIITWSGITQFIWQLPSGKKSPHALKNIYRLIVSTTTCCGLYLKSVGPMNLRIDQKLYKSRRRLVYWMEVIALLLTTGHYDI